MSAARGTTPPASNLSERRRRPHKPLRTQSTIDQSNESYPSRPMRTHSRHKSSLAVSSRSRDATPSPRRASTHLLDGALGVSTEKPSPRTSLELTPIESKGLTNGDMASPPATPVKMREPSQPAREDLGADSMSFDFSKIDYELARARCIGQGLWSKVWLADAKHPERRRPALPTPPSSPPKWTARDRKSVV